jgi:hypothetical protein
MPDYAERDRDMYSLKQRARASGNAGLRPVVLNSRLRLFILSSASYVGQAGRLRRASRERKWAEWTWWTQSTEWTSGGGRAFTLVSARSRSFTFVASFGEASRPGRAENWLG